MRSHMQEWLARSAQQHSFVLEMAYNHFAKYHVALQCLPMSVPLLITRRNRQRTCRNCLHSVMHSTETLQSLQMQFIVYAISVHSK